MTQSVKIPTRRESVRELLLPSPGDLVSHTLKINDIPPSAGDLMEEKEIGIGYQHSTGWEWSSGMRVATCRSSEDLCPSILA